MRKQRLKLPPLSLAALILRGCLPKGRAYAEAQVTTAVRKLSGPSLSDFTENTFGTSASYIDAVRQAYDQLIENIDRAIGVIGSEDISPFELPEAVEAAREGLPANLKKELEQLRQRKELVALAKTLGLAAAEAGLALLPVIGPALAFGVGLYFIGIRFGISAGSTNSSDWPAKFGRNARCKGKPG